MVLSLLLVGCGLDKPMAEFVTLTFDNGVTVMAEVADDEFERMTGLSGREKLAENEGMCFVFPTEGQHRFWMKDMKFPLDLIFVDSNFTVVGWHENLQPCYGVSCGRYTSREPAQYVLEMEAWWSSTNGIDKGARVEVKR